VDAIYIGNCTTPTRTAVTATINPLPATPTITASGPTTFCSGGSVTLTSSAGSSYLWSTGATTQSIIVTTSGSYTVRVTNTNGCQSAVSAATTVIVNPLPATPTITANGPTTFCSGGNVTLTSSAGTTYLWSNGATTQSIIVTTSGSYTVRVTNTNGCQSAASAAKVVTVNPLPATPTVSPSDPISICSGGSVTLTSSAGTSYLWSTGATTQSITVSISGSYTVRVTNTNGCQSAASAPKSVTVNPLPATPTVSPSGSISLCAGNCATLIAPLSTSYQWSTGETTQSIVVCTAGSYSVRVGNANGCYSAFSTPVVVTVNPLPATPTITASGPTTFCSGGSVTLTSSAGTSYLWSTGATTQSIIVSTSGSYTVRVTNASGCQSAISAATTVTVYPLPATPTVSPSGSISLCAGNCATLTAPLSTSYQWSNGETTQTIVVCASGSYSVRVGNANGCFSAFSTPVVVTVNPLPATPTITANGPTTFCSGGSVILTSSAGTSYLWSTGATTQSITVNSSGNYTVRVTNASGCQSAASAATTVTVNALPTVANAGPNQQVAFACGPKNITLAANAPGAGETGTWSIVSGTGGIINSPNSPTSTFTFEGDLGTTYVLRWTISNATCPSSFDDVTISIENLYNIPDIELEALCAFYNSTNGDNWTNTQNSSEVWFEDINVDNWFGIKIESGFVSMITIADNNLTGSIPSQIGNLTFLKHIAIANEKGLTGSIPIQIQNLTVLEVLFLANNNLNGVIPSCIGNCESLEVLMIYDNSITGIIPIEIGNLSSLNLLLLDENLTGTLPAELGALYNLWDLGLCGNSLSGGIPTTWEALGCGSIDLSNNNLSGNIPSSILDAYWLYSLNLSHNSFTGSIPTEICNAPSMYLYLNNNYLTGDVPECLCSLSILELEDGPGYNDFVSNPCGKSSYITEPTEPPTILEDFTKETIKAAVKGESLSNYFHQHIVDKKQFKQVASNKKMSIATQIKVYPNPAKGIVYIESPYENYNTSLYDYTGRCVLNQASCGKETLNIAHLRKGIYLLVVEAGGKQETTKITIE
jgi:hypothetical protein